MTDRPKSKHDRLPLMDEVNDLIEKERTLLNLKLLAQKTEAEEWKAKYDLLVDKVSSGTVDIKDNQQPMETAAEVENVEGSEFTSLHDVQRLLNDRVSSWILDLSDVKMDKILFAKLSKAVFGARNSFETINTALFENCGLNDEYSPALLSIIRSSRLQAINLSNNDLNEVFFLQLLTTLKVSLLVIDRCTVFKKHVQNDRLIILYTHSLTHSQ